MPRLNLSGPKTHPTQAECLGDGVGMFFGRNPCNIRAALCFLNMEKQMNKLQILYLRRLHGLTEAQAQALATLIWGAS